MWRNPKAIKIPGVEDATEKIDTESSTEQASLEGARRGSRGGSCRTSSLDGPRGVSHHASLDGARRGSSHASSMDGPRGASDCASSDGLRRGSSCGSPSDGAREGSDYAPSDGTSRTSSLTHFSRTSPMTGTLEGTSFTDEQLKRFQIRYDEGTDVYIDPDYIQWLELYHSESLLADRYSLTSAIASTDESLQTSLAEHFHSITPEVPLDSVDTVFTSDADSQHSNALISADKLREICQEVSPISKFLVSPLPATSSVPETLPCAHLLTSTQCLAQLEEKRQKQLAIQEKEQRKLDREEKKSKREQEQKRKAEEIVKKAKEKARKVKEMAEKAKKAAEKERKAAKRAAKKHQRKAGGANKNPTAEATDEPPQKKQRREVCPMNDVDSEGIDEDMCCKCFGTYTDNGWKQSGRDWIKCACSRWLHEDCAEDYKVDDSGED